MQGTCSEVLLWLTSDSKYANLFNMSRQRLVTFRYKIASETLSDDTKEEFLKKVQKNLEKYTRDTQGGYSRLIMTGGLTRIECLRPRYILPAVVADHRGRTFHENTLVKMCSKQQGFDDLNLQYVVATLGNKGLLRRKSWSMVEERHILPSVWFAE